MGLFDKLFNRSEVKTLDSSDLGWSSLNSVPYLVENKSFKDPLQESTVFACINYLATDIAKIPCRIFKEESDGGKTLALDHPLYKLFRYGPNNYQTTYDFFEYVMWSLLKKGNAYSFIVRDPFRNISGLYPIEPGRVQVYEDETGDLFYGISPGTGHDRHVWEKLAPYIDENSEFMIPGRHIWHLKDIPSGNGTKGMSRLDAQWQIIRQSLNQREFSNSQIENRSAPSVVLSSDQKISPERAKALKEQWDEKFQGPSKAFKTAVLEGGMKPHPLKIEYGDLELIQKMKLTDVDISRIFRVPMSKLNVREGSSFNNQETENQNYINDSLMPFMEKIESSIDKYLLGSENNYVSGFDVNRLLRGDSKARAELYRTSRQWGVLSANECRIMEGKNPRPEGNQLHIPMNMGVLGESNDEGEQ